MPGLLENIPQPGQSQPPVAPQPSPQPAQISLPGMSITPTSAEPMPAERGPAGITNEAFLAAGNSSSPTDSSAFLSAGASDTAPAPGANNFSDLEARFAAAMGTTDTEKLSVLKTKFGDKNARIKETTDENGNKEKTLQWRRQGDKKFHDFNDKNVRLGFELLGDILDQGGAAVQGLGSALGGAIGTSAAVGTGGLAAIPIVGAGMAAGTAAGESARRGLLQASGGTPDPNSFVPNVAAGATAQAAAETGVGAISKVAEPVWQGMKSMMQHIPDSVPHLQRAAQLVRMGVDDMVERFVPGAASTKIQSGEVGKTIGNAYQAQKQLLGSMMDNAESKILQNGLDNRYPADNLLQQLKSFLDEKKLDGVFFEPQTGHAIVGGGTNAPIAPLGLPKEVGKRTLQSIVEDYNTLIDANKVGGLNAKNWLDLTRSYQRSVNYESAQTSSAEGMMMRLASAAKRDRDPVFKTLGGDISQAFSRYEANTQDLNHFAQLIHTADQTGKTSVIADGIFQTDNPARIRAFMNIFRGVPAEGVPGDVTVADQLKGLFLQKLEKESLTSEGLLNGHSFLRTMDEYGSTLPEVFSKEELGQLKLIGGQAKRLLGADDPAAKADIIMRFLALKPVRAMLPGTRLSFIGSITNDKEAIMNLLEPSQLAKIRSWTPSQKDDYFRVAQSLLDEMMTKGQAKIKPPTTLSDRVAHMRDNLIKDTARRLLRAVPAAITAEEAKKR